MCVCLSNLLSEAAWFDQRAQQWSQSETCSQLALKQTSAGVESDGKEEERFPIKTFSFEVKLQAGVSAVVFSDLCYCTAPLLPPWNKKTQQQIEK